MLTSAPSSTLRPVEKPIEKLNFSSTHAESMVKEGVLTSREANMWADALSMDANLVESVVGEDITNICKDQIISSKQFITDQEIKKLPEFKKFLAEYMAERGRIYQTNVNQVNEKNKKDLLASMGVSPDLQAKREKINSIKNAVRNLISEKDEKSRGASVFVSDIIKMSSGDTKIDNANILYEFIYESFASPNEKKKRKPDEDAAAFYKRTGIDYSFRKIRERITAEESKINTQVAKQKTKEIMKLDSKKMQIQAPILDQKVYEADAFSLFCKTGVLEEKYYLEKDKSEIIHLQDFFRGNIQKSKKQHPALTIHENTDKRAKNGIAIRQENSSVLSPSDYIYLQVNQKTMNDYFVSGDRTIKGYLFDRLIECVGYDILEYKIKENLAHFPQYRGASFELYKTEMLDDTFAKADYALELHLPNAKDIEIKLIDLFVSDKSKESTGYQEKYKKAQEPKIPYQMYMNLLLDNKYDTIEMKPFKRFVEQQSPKEVHDLLLKIVKEPGFNLQKYLLEKSERTRILAKNQEKDLVAEMRRLSA